MSQTRSFAAVLQGLWAEVPGLVDDRVDLLALELRRAGSALAQILVLTLAAALFGLAAWIALWVGLAAFLLAMGVHWAATTLLVVLVNGATVVWIVVRLRRLSPLLAMPATRRHFRWGTASAEDERTPPKGTSP